MLKGAVADGAAEDYPAEAVLDHVMENTARQERLRMLQLKSDRGDGRERMRSQRSQRLLKTAVQ